MKTSRSITALLNGKLVDVALEIDIEKDFTNLRARYPNGETYVVQGIDLTIALWRLHDAVSKTGSQLLCYGLTENVHPSRMSSQMGLGRQAYILTMGKQAGTDDLVDIFDRPKLFALSSPYEQSDFFKTWLNSLK